ncbi:MAG: DNA-binding protein, partial [Clostridium sp.]|nr:DNA-binding protein [Clostridium sp.]
MNRTKIEVKTIFTIITLFFIGFLVLPLGILFFKSIQIDGGIGFENYKETISNPELLRAVKNSTIVSLCAAVITTIISFILSYVLNCTRIFTPIKKCIRLGVILPMLLPTITYGFAIIYSFGKQGLLTKIFGRELLNIYGFNGLLIGYVIYTLPSSFLLINNSFKYIDKKFIIVSNLMGDNRAKQLINTKSKILVKTNGYDFIWGIGLAKDDENIDNP